MCPRKQLEADGYKLLDFWFKVNASDKSLDLMCEEWAESHGMDAEELKSFCWEEIDKRVEAHYRSYV